MTDHGNYEGAEKAENSAIRLTQRQEGQRVTDRQTHSRKSSSLKPPQLLTVSALNNSDLSKQTSALHRPMCPFPVSTSHWTTTGAILQQEALE